MKKIVIIFCLTFIFLSACQDKTIEDVFTEIKDHTPYMQHEWNLKQVVQTDENAGPGKLKSLDISSAILSEGEAFINFDGNNFTASGIISDGIGTNGTWSFDNPNFPVKIITSSDLGQAEILLGKSILEFSTELNLKDSRVSCKENLPTVSYEYIFEKKI